MPLAKDVFHSLSSAQQLVWLDQSLHPDLPLYHIGAAILLEGELDLALLEKAVTLFSNQHDALRLVLYNDQQGPRQRITQAGDCALPLVDCSAHADSDATAWDYLHQQFIEPFDLHGGKLWSMCIVRTGPDRHYWLQRYHHVVADGSSVALAITGIAHLYNALRKGDAGAAPASTSYLSFLDADQSYRASSRHELDRTFWRSLFTDIPPVLIPKRQGAPGAEAAPSEQLQWKLPRELFDQMRLHCAKHDVSVMHFMLALISLYFARTQDLDEVVIGVSVHNRGANERNTVGMFSSIIPVKIGIDRKQTFAQFMLAVASSLRQSYRHRRFPISEINRDLELWRHGRRQVFDVALSFESFEVECDVGGMRPHIIPLHHGVEQTPMAVFVRDYRQDQDVTVELNFNCAFFDRAAVQDMQSRWALLLQAALAGQDQTIGQLPMLTAAERQLVVAQFNDTRVVYPDNVCLHELFEAQARNTPEATALVFGDQALSYASLNAEANGLAHYLRQAGVRPDTRVAVCLERSLEMVVCLLAILKAGAAYVPLDPQMPDERLRDVLDDCAPLLLFTSGRPAPAGIPQVDMRTDTARWAALPATNPGRDALTPANLAYIIYTSGSTGKPKGVMIEHRSIVNRLFWMQEAYALAAHDAVLQKTPYGFDVSVWEFFWPLCFGAKLVMAQPQGHRDPAYLCETIRRHRITTIHFVPSMLQLFLAHHDAPSCTSLKRVVCSGEALPVSLAQRCHTYLPQAGLYNLYGPTEAAVDVTAWTSDPALLDAGVPIGKPIANTAIYILDREQQPVAPGMVGELHIGGVQVARGYWNRPDLTAERFIDDPFSVTAGARLYKTGDLARWRADGNIDYLGRNDFQVKIRGFRIELGEIETCLAHHAAVQEALVLARTDRIGDAVLVAYYIGGSEIASSALRTHLAARLPDYMVPAVFVRLACWPVTPNGKLDRKALPEPADYGQVSREYAAPQGDIEIAVAELWQDLLAREQVGRHDHFFELGGHSLKAAQLVSRVRARLGVALPLATLFSHPVLLDFSARIAGAAQGALAPIQTAARGGPLPLSFAQQGLWFMTQLEQAGAAYHLAGGLWLEGILDTTALVKALDRIVQRHEALRTTFRTSNGQPEQIIAPDNARFSIVMHDLRSHPDDEQELRRLTQEEANTPFDLARGPLLRGRLLRLRDDSHILLITMHHIVSDGWSIGVLFNEMSALYAAFSQGLADPLPAMALQYADYALWQRNWLQGDVLRQQRDFWGTYLAGAPAVLALPADRARPAVQDYAGATIDFTLDAALSGGLRTLSRRHGTTLFMTLLSGWAVLLARLSGQFDVVIGSPVANRQRADFEGMIGFFINTLALRIGVSGTVAQLLAHVKESTLAAQTHQDIPFEQVVELLKPARSLAHHPLFQVAFTWQNAPEGGLAMPGLEVASFASPRTFSKTDCWLVAGEAGDTIVGSIDYATALFDRATMERYLAQWRLLLEAMVADDQQAVTQLPLLTAHERRQMLLDWNASERDFPRAPFLPQWFEAQAAQTPQAIALVKGATQLSYAQLNSEANRLAHYLIGIGVRPETRVAIGMERSVDMVVALLAVLKAGAAYVPLDPGYPAERLAYLLADSAPLALLTHSALGWDAPPTRINLDQRVWEACPDSNPEVALRPDNLAYIIYTSGSTGHPKGVMIEHAALLNYLHWALETYRPAKGSVVSSSVAFDATITSLFTPLLCGASVTLLAEGDEIEGLEACLQSPQGAGLVKITPAHLDILGQRLEGKPCAVDVFVIGGEALAPATVQRWQRIAPHARLINEYGPTETVVGCASFEVTNQLDGNVPIGRPIANTRLYVLDAERQPVPLGATGELYIGGAGVARGYWQRPDLSAERFIADPFKPGERLYKTGDLARWRADGNLDYLGRNDFQVKIRGFRIELGEIEAQLAACDGVRDAVVMAREDNPGDKRLVAYFNGAATVSAAALRAHLAEKLPDYMVPGAYIYVDNWPLTSNGKLDRDALPRPGDDAYAAATYVAPQGQIEQALAAMWSELLDIERIGRHDNFFLLDGNSLLAIQVIARVRQQFGATIGLAELFAQPVLSDFAACIAGATQSDLPAVAKAPREGHLPLSFAQQRLWFLAQLDQASTAYHIAGGLQLKGKLNRTALNRTLDRIVQRHEALRTTFRANDGEAAQIVAHGNVGLPLSFHDLQAHPQPEQALRRHADEEADAAFDLEHGPLIRGRLLQLSDDTHVLLVTMHHIVSDGWSISVLFNEITALYPAFSQNLPDPLPPLALQYTDYAVWQRGWLQGDVLQKQLDFWSSCLAGAPALLELPTDRPRPAMQDYAGASIDFSFNAALTGAVKALSQRHGATLFMTLLASWAVLLSRLSGQSDLVIGSPVANRQRTEFEGLIGLFVNTLALRIDLSGAPTVAQLLARVKGASVAAQSHQDIPFEQIVELLKPARSLAHPPLFQVMFSWQNLPERRLDLPGLTLADMPAHHTTAKFDLSVSLQEAGDTISGDIDFATALFDRATVERHLVQWRLLLEAMVADDQQAVTQLPLLTAHERRQMLLDWNASERDFPRAPFLPQWFEAQAAQTPQAIALVQGATQLSYAQLNSEANRLAHYLIGIGVRPETRVAIGMERSVDMVVALLAVLKAGAAYVPLDPGYPAERLAYLLADSAPLALLTHSALGWDAPPTRINLDQRIWEACPDSNPEVALRPDNLAYIIYTSGSTGHPKGVMIEHAALLNYLHWALETYRPAKGSVVSSSVAFDATITSLFTPLLCGASVTLLAEGDEIEGLEACLQSPQGAGLVKITPAHLDILGQRLEGKPCAVDVFVIGGEALAPATVQRWQRIAPHARLINEYGPTETVVGCASFEVTNQLDGNVPIGRPIANTRLYVLDAERQPVPLGATGELYIGGAGVARGYWQRPDLSAERFIADPFKPGERLYKTGDLARWRADGNLDYLGRNDFQVKIRGFRIELGEIEAQLAACDGVRDAVVLAREDNPGDKRLVAYFNCANTATAEALRAQLAAQLPDYMVPVAYIRIDSWPLTSNGKLDRQALPAPGDDALATRAYAPPQGETEWIIARIWQELLGVKQLGRHDDFFALGGHSLLAVRVLARLRQAVGCELGVRELFAAPELAAFAQSVRQAARAALPPITEAERDGPLPLSPMQQRLWLLDQFNPEAGAAYHMPAALRLQGRLHPGALQATLDRLLARHESLRTTFVQIDGQACQVIAPSTTSFALTLHDLRERTVDVARLMDDEANAPFSLSTGPLIRGRLLRLADEEHILLITQHHIVSDGWSISVMIDEFNALYAAFAQGQPDPLPPLPIQYADYALWQRRQLQGDAHQGHIDFWRAHLEGAPALLDLPTDRPRPPTQSHDGALHEFTLDATLAEGLHRLSRQHGCTTFMTLLAGWSVLMARMAGQDDVVIGTPVANRPHAQADGLIGFFVNTLALRVRIAPEATVEDLLAQVKASTLDAYAHQDLPFERVVDALQPSRNARHSPLFQVMLVWDNTPPKAAVTLPGLSVTPVPLRHASSQFDLSLSLSESRDGIVARLEYATALFDAATVERLAGSFRHLLGAMASDAQQTLSTLPLLDEAGRRQVLVDFNDSARDFPRDQLIHAVFEEQAARQPDATALVYDDTRVSYRELNCRANQVAHALLARGVRADDRVALCMERGTGMVVALLGILKAGAGYVPLDPSLPAARLAWLLEDAAPAALLTESALHSALPPLTVPVLALDTEALDHFPGTNPDLEGLSERNLAYVIYTSGSTGMPKGVMVEHASVLNLWNALRDTAFRHCGRNARVGLNAALSFDASVQSLVQLLSGHCVVIIPSAVRADGPALLAYLRRQQVEAFDCTPAQLSLLIPAGLLAPSAIHTVLIGGEAIGQATWRALTAAPHLHCYNVYGPTECCVNSTLAEMSAADELPHLGRPLANTRAYVLDSRRQPVPVGVVGELYIGGAGVARGYWQRPELTAERFIADPFTDNARLYQTGDLARWRADGTLEYLGRNDFQVKIRGYRIELGEIETRLLDLDDVAEAVVIAHAERLVAYLVARRDSALEPALLRAHLAAILPDYMVPAAFVVLPSLPTTANGKLDRQALPSPDATAVASRSYQAPQGPVEAALAELWKDLLALPQVGRHDQFFELGGHSLSAVSLATRMREQFEIAVPLRAIFDHAELAQLADFVTSAQIALYLDTETQAMAADLDSLTEDQLLAILEGDTSNG